MKLPSSNSGRIWLAFVVIFVAIVGGSIAGRELFAPSAAVKVRTVRVAQTASSKYGVLQAQARAHPVPKKVPFLGPFAHNQKHIQQCGPAVRLMEGALRRTTPPVRTQKPAVCVGKLTEHQIKIFQKRHHIPQTGIYGTRTHKALSPHYTAKARADLLYTAHLQVVRKERQTVLIVTSHANLVGQRMGYTQGGERSYFPPWPRVPPNTDCSGFATWVMYQSGVGFRVGYFGSGSPVGWTGTLGRQGKFVPTNGRLAVGDLVFYGGGFPYGHVEVYIGHGMTEGHGSPGIHVHVYNYRPVSAVRRMIF